MTQSSSDLAEPVFCPECGELISEVDFAKYSAGERMRCPHCKKLVWAPGPGADLEPRPGN